MASKTELEIGIYASSDSRTTNTLLTLERGRPGSVDVEIEIPPGESFW